MKKPLRFDFDQPGTVFSNELLTGRGVKFVCKQLDGTLVYQITEAAEKRLLSIRNGVYVNQNGQEVAI